jgi:hypothetical protein
MVRCSLLVEGGTAMTVRITRLEHDADALRQRAGRMSAAPVARRLLTLALVLLMPYALIFLTEQLPAT